MSGYMLVRWGAVGPGPYDISTSKERLVLVAVVCPVLKLDGGVGPCDYGTRGAGDRIALMAVFDLGDVAVESSELLLSGWVYESQQRSNTNDDTIYCWHMRSGEQHCMPHQRWRMLQIQKLRVRLVESPTIESHDSHIQLETGYDW